MTAEEEKMGTSLEVEEEVDGDLGEEEGGDEEDEAGVNYEDEGDGAIDPELEEMKKRVAEMEAEADKLKALQQELQDDGGEGNNKNSDETSIYVGQVDYDATPEELQNHFASCGTINRVTILCDRKTGQSKGYAYVEFEEADSVQNAIMLDNSIFKGRQLKVTAKRTNLPNRGRGRGRGGFRGRRGGFRGRGGYYRGGYRGGYRGYRGY
mmetsp:Transcript_4224/g.5949  ORF Transcript_4224/g.5949 Transcript_4224/m.5949 type:complete len:209 (+) Transcript_4224:45-671(+)|eukprot:CAMPEP_0197291100 /NCGR_PEP_ID=MMETSP0890-20130614/11661_1 /TAXON_ID=44058 ORGANISM="Aureoumbra lagunensis, Strain CCMP1510" /NCGR_SAMPLE_ID=MMETSP0890 /ASSEMBLY_ACC=CAM_ASM_000533 /LENGTH=208 /DNA_ID=CAMNT_0042763669 /DNA_START=35 /DNA_END=661 /DNA_ORIENTATION=-